MTTNEERREVAERLRKTVEEKNGIYNTLDASPFANICSGLLLEYKVGANDYIHCCDVMLRIADLIEPEPEERTCTFSVYQSGDEHFPTCSECGYEAAREECEDYVGVVYYEKRFCPNCGAKVVEQ